MRLCKFALLLVLITFSGCTTSRLTSVWVLKNVDFSQFQDILVVAQSFDGDSSLQRGMEKYLVANFNNLGYRASASTDHEINGVALLTMPAVIKKLQYTNIDAVFSVVLLNKKSSPKYMPGSFPASSPGNLYYYGYQTGEPRTIYDGGYFVNFMEYYWSIAIYDIKSRIKVCSAQMHSVDQVNPQLMAYEYGKIIMKDLKKNKVLLQKEKLKPF